jgi:hypothetical protein
LVVYSPSHPFYPFGLKQFFLHDVMCTKLGLPHPLAFGLSHYIYGQPLDPMGIHLLCCVHGGEKITSHNVVWDAFASIMKDVGFHGACE